MIPPKHGRRCRCLSLSRILGSVILRPCGKLDECHAGADISSMDVGDGDEEVIPQWQPEIDGGGYSTPEQPTPMFEGYFIAINGRRLVKEEVASEVRLYGRFGEDGRGPLFLFKEVC